LVRRRFEQSVLHNPIPGEAFGVKGIVGGLDVSAVSPTIDFVLPVSPID